MEWESALGLRVLNKLIWGLEPLVGIAEISFHLLAELVRSFFASSLDFPAFNSVQLSRQRRRAVRKTIGTLRTGFWLAFTRYYPSDLHASPSEIHNEAADVRETVCDSQGTNIPFFSFGSISTVIP